MIACTGSERLEALKILTCHNYYTECFVQNSKVSYPSEWTTNYSCVASGHMAPQLLIQYHCNILSISYNTLHKLVVMGTKHTHFAVLQ